MTDRLTPALYGLAGTLLVVLAGAGLYQILDTDFIGMMLLFIIPISFIPGYA